MTDIRIGDRLIGDGHPCWIVAELCANHNGDPDLAKRLIDAAAKAGANAVKLQRRTVGRLMTRELYDRPYQGPASYGTTYGRHRDALELADADWPGLQRCAHDLGLTFFASAWDEDAADFLEALDVPCFKVGSPDLTNTPLLSHLASKGRPVVLATGMADADEVALAVESLQGVPLILMHCVSVYPAEPALLNLRAIQTLKETYQCPTGWSGHETGVATSVAAAVLGANVLERHVTLNRADKGPDHAASLEPEGLRRLVRDVRNVEAALGDGVKRLLDQEWPARARLGKSLVARRDLPVGHVLRLGDLDAKCPGVGLPPYRLRSVVGRRLARAMAEEAVLVEGDLAP